MLRNFKQKISESFENYHQNIILNSKVWFVKLWLKFVLQTLNEFFTCRKFWKFMWTKINKKSNILKVFFSSNEKLTFEKENVILFNIFLNLNLFYLIVVNFAAEVSRKPLIPFGLNLFNVSLGRLSLVVHGDFFHNFRRKKLFENSKKCKKTRKKAIL